MSYDNICSKIDLIANTGIGQKINVKSGTLSGWLPSIDRFWKGENRETLAKFMDDIIEELPIIIRSLNKVDLFLLKCKLKTAPVGIMNLLSTYKEDEKMRTKIANFNVKIVECINNIEIREIALFKRSENVEVGKEKIYVKTLDIETASPEEISKSLSRPKLLHDFKNEIRTV